MLAKKHEKLKMSDLYWLIIAICLVGTNIFTVFFYQKQINALVDRLMSRNYAEFVQARALEQSDHFPNKGRTQEEPIAVDDEVLRELNQTFSL